jgi:hypothetical protein
LARFPPKWNRILLAGILTTEVENPRLVPEKVENWGSDSASPADYARI